MNIAILITITKSILYFIITFYVNTSVIRHTDILCVFYTFE